VKSNSPPPRPRAKVWKAWAVVAKDDGTLLLIDQDDGFTGTLMATYDTRDGARADTNDGERVVRVEIREIPRPPRPVKRARR